MSVPTNDDPRTTTSGGGGVSSTPDLVVGTGKLEGFRCPTCGQAEAFQVLGEVLLNITPDEIKPGEMDWNDYSYGTCPACGHNDSATTFFMNRRRS